MLVQDCAGSLAYHWEYQTTGHLNHLESSPAALKSPCALNSRKKTSLDVFRWAGVI